MSPPGFKPFGLQVQTAVKTRMMDATYGYNAWITVLAPNYGITDLSPYLIQWASPGSVFYGDIEPGDVITGSVLEEEEIVYPLCIIAISGGNDNKNEVYAVFSGTIDVSIRHYIQWPLETPLTDYDLPCFLQEEAMFRMFSEQMPPYYWAVPQVPPILRLGYNGAMRSSRGKVTTGAENRERRIVFSFSMFVDVA